MTATNDNLPAMARKRELITILDSFVSFGKWRNVLTEHAEHLLVTAQRVVRESSRFIKMYAFFRCAASAITDKQAAQQIFVSRHPEVDAIFISKPPGTTNVIRVQMCHDDMFERFVAHQLGDGFFPDALTVFSAHTGINCDPAIVIFQQPKINMRQLKRQGHAQPVDTIGNLKGFPQLRV